jgi:helix-turn-helix protein
MNLPPPTSIEKEGLKNYLDRTASIHHGKGYADFVEIISSDLNYTKRQIAKIFNVTRPTIYDWIALFEKEQSK